MNTTPCITNMYMSVLSSLSNDEKLDLISKLSDSMRRKKPSKKIREVYSTFNQDWGGNSTPEEIAEDLRKSRIFTREVEEW